MLEGTTVLPMWLNYRDAWKVSKKKSGTLEGDWEVVNSHDFEELWMDWVTHACEFKEGLNDHHQFVFGSVRTTYHQRESDYELPKVKKNDTEAEADMLKWRQRPMIPLTEHYNSPRVGFPNIQQVRMDLSVQSGGGGGGAEEGGGGLTTEAEPAKSQDCASLLDEKMYGPFILNKEQVKNWNLAGKPSWFFELLNVMFTKLPEAMFSKQLEFDIGQVMAFNPNMRQRAGPQPFHLDVAASSIYPQLEKKQRTGKERVDGGGNLDSMDQYPAGYIVIIPFGDGYHLEVLKEPNGVKTFEITSQTPTDFCKTGEFYRLSQRINDVQVAFGNIVCLPLSVIHRGQGVPEDQEPIKPLFRLHMFLHVQGHSKTTQDVDGTQLWECEMWDPEKHNISEVVRGSQKGKRRKKEGETPK